ncbi:MAG: hypothetical protein ACT4QF_11675 [Sporichthyaceae bacterium]
MDSTPSERVVDRRVRNRVIEYLELASSFEGQREYAARAPSYVDIPNEVVNQWDDWVRPSDLDGEAAVYTAAEVQTMSSYLEALDRANAAVVDSYPDLAHVQTLPEWQALREAALDALAVFAVRGRLSEDVEEDR